MSDSVDWIKKDETKSVYRFRSNDEENTCPLQNTPLSVTVGGTPSVVASSLTLWNKLWHQCARILIQWLDIYKQEHVVSKRTISRTWGNRNSLDFLRLVFFENGEEIDFLSNENFKKKSKLKNNISFPHYNMHIWFCAYMYVWKEKCEF